MVGSRFENVDAFARQALECSLSAGRTHHYLTRSNPIFAQSRHVAIDRCRDWGTKIPTQDKRDNVYIRISCANTQPTRSGSTALISFSGWLLR